ncbi:MAG: deoxyribonuclease IV [Oscillospiraceae bacterium]
MLKIGAHLSVSKGFYAMCGEALRIKANTFQFFTRNPRGGAAKELDDDDILRYEQLARENGIFEVIAHAPYTLNACSADSGIRRFAINTMADDLSRCDRIPGALYNFHPGSHVGQGEESGVGYICDMLDEVMSKAHKTTVLLETMSGKGSEIGSTFEQLRAIMDRAKYGDKLGVCLDTCHVHDAGYDIVGDLDGVLEKFDRVVGLSRLKAVHLNDSMNIAASHKDRHQKIGEGNLGLKTFEAIINHPALRELPFCLETPNEPDGYAAEIELLRGLYKN